MLFIGNTEAKQEKNTQEFTFLTDKTRHYYLKHIFSHIYVINFKMTSQKFFFYYDITNREIVKME